MLKGVMRKHGSTGRQPSPKRLTNNAIKPLALWTATLGLDRLLSKTNGHLCSDSMLHKNKGGDVNKNPALSVQGRIYTPIKCHNTHILCHVPRELKEVLWPHRPLPDSASHCVFRGYPTPLSNANGTSDAWKCEDVKFRLRSGSQRLEIENVWSDWLGRLHLAYTND